VAHRESATLYVVMGDEAASFERFAIEVEPRLRRALVATYGTQVGREATVDALAYAWEHREQIVGMANPAGYLYRVGQTSARYQLKTPPMSPLPSPAAESRFEPGLRPALTALTEQQRTVVLLVHGYGWSQREVARLLGLSASTVRNHLGRAMRHLRKALEGTHVG
jgi:RNA polymerase sigma factor (sigma-70 family)